MSGKQPSTLYDLSITVAMSDHVSLCKTRCMSSKTDFRWLPDNVLFDFYYKVRARRNPTCVLTSKGFFQMYEEKLLCFLWAEFGELEVFIRMLKVGHKRAKLLKSFQTLVTHGMDVVKRLVASYSAYRNVPEQVTPTIIDNGLKLGGFLNEGGWYPYAIDTLNIVEELCTLSDSTTNMLCKLLDCYHK